MLRFTIRDAFCRWNRGLPHARIQSFGVSNAVGGVTFSRTGIL